MRLYESREKALACLEKIRQRGAALADSVISLGDEKYAVPSASQAGKVWIVDTRRETCACPSYQELNLFHSHDDLPVRCKHIWAVVFWKKGGCQ